MNNSLENTTIEKIHSIGETGDIIIQNLANNTHGFETFVELLSITTWRSHRELTDAWIWKVAGEEYAKLLSENESPEIDEIKAYAVDMVREYAFDALYECTQNLSRWQQLKSKFLVCHTLAHELPIRDQDCIIAQELGIPHESWQQMLGFFSHNMEFVDILRLQKTSMEEAINAGKKWFVLTTPERNLEQIAPLGVLPGIELMCQSDEENTPLLFIGEEVLKRYSNIFRLKEKETIIRNTIRDRFGNIYVYKRFLGGTGKNQTDSKQKLASEKLF